MGFLSEGFISKPLILVADSVDNKFNNENNQNDQTHIVALGSEVEFRNQNPTGDPIATISVAKRKEVHITVKLLWQGNTAPSQLAIDNILDDLEIASEIYSQTGIHLNFTITVNQVNISGVDFGDGLQLDTNQNPGVLATEGDVLLNNFATPNQTDVVAL